MGRSGYDEDYDCDSHVLNLYRANVDRSLAGKRGQTFLCELVAALDALPQKALIRNSFVEGEGVCALGAVARMRGIQDRFVGIEVEDDSNVRYIAEIFDIAECLAREIMFENDEACFYVETDERRWERVYCWAVRNIKGEPS